MAALQAAYAQACSRLVRIVQARRCWNRVDLHRLAYTMLRTQTPLGAQMCCNTIFSVCKAYRAQQALGRIGKDAPVPALRFDRASVHVDKRTYTLRGDDVSLCTLAGRMMVALRPGEHQRRILASGSAKEAELICRKGRWYFKLVVETDDVDPLASGPAMGLDVGEITLAAASTGRVWGGEALRHWRDQSLALRRRLQSNGSQSAKKLRQVSGKERRRVRVGKRIRTPLHRWTFRQLQTFVEYTARACGLRAHAAVNASRNLARIGSGAPPPKAVVNTPIVGCLVRHASP
ncbi:MAG TPA: hypothetical protein VGD47_02835 [Steroidobacteraceae bacterium]